MTGNFAVKAFSNLMVSLLILIGPGIESYAQGNKVSFGASGGGGYYQFNDFINEIDKAGKLISDGGRSFTSINNSGFGRFLNLKIAYRLSAESEIVGSFDFVRTAPQGRATHSFIGGISGTSDEEWKITYLPVSIIFQHHFTGISRKIVPSVGVGTSISVLNVAARQTFNSALDDDLKITNETNSQVKFGVNAFLDLQGTITDKLFVTTRLQAHYIPEMDLYDRTNNANYTIDLSGMNITAGLGIRW